jgi:hypothetical protein
MEVHKIVYVFMLYSTTAEAALVGCSGASCMIVASQILRSGVYEKNGEIREGRIANRLLKMLS